MIKTQSFTYLRSLVVLVASKMPTSPLSSNKNLNKSTFDDTLVFTHTIQSQCCEQPSHVVLTSKEVSLNSSKSHLFENAPSTHMYSKILFFCNHQHWKYGYCSRSSSSNDATFSQYNSFLLPIEKMISNRIKQREVNDWGIQEDRPWPWRSCGWGCLKAFAYRQFLRGNRKSSSRGGNTDVGHGSFQLWDVGHARGPLHGE